MPTKVASYLTELGFKELANTDDAANYNKDTAGQYIVITSLNRMYRYEASSSAVADGITVLNSSTTTAKWISVGGSPMTQEHISGVFNTAGNTITLNKKINDPNEILYINIGNTQILRNEYVNNITINANSTVITLPNTIPVNTNYEVVLFTGNTQASPQVDYSILPNTLYQGKLEVTGNTIELNNACTIYSKTISSATTLDFTMPNGYTSALGVVTFELYINMTSAVSILWTPTISWNGGTAPLFNAVKKYLLSFRTFDGGSTWIGNLEMEW